MSDGGWNALNRRRGLIARGAALVAIGVSGVSRPGLVKLRDLIRREVPSDGPEVVAQLLFVSGPDNHRRHCRTLQEPVERDLWNRFSGLLGNRIQRIDNSVEVFIRNRR